MSAAICREALDGTSPHNGKNVHSGTSVFAATPGATIRVNGRGIVTIGSTTACGDVAIGGSSNVRANGKFVHRVGDQILTHTGGISVSASGSPPGTINA